MFSLFIIGFRVICLIDTLSIDSLTEVNCI